MGTDLCRETTTIQFKKISVSLKRQIVTEYRRLSLDSYYITVRKQRIARRLVSKNLTYKTVLRQILSLTAI
jgi:hypothetical protein